MNILWLSWKDIEHPLSGGAEVVGHNIRTRLAQNGHSVTLIADRFAGSAPEATTGGYRTVRRGRRDVYLQAYRAYKKEFAAWPDVVIDEMNTLPFFARWYVRQKSVLFVHQLAREVWLYQLPAPLSWIGFIAEPIYLWLLSGYRAITVSESTKKDLVRYGFSPEKISIISEGIEIEPLASLDPFPKKDSLGAPVFLVLGSIRPMKRTLEAVRAFEHIADTNPKARLVVAGGPSGSYGKKVLEAIRTSRHASKIEVRGRVTPEEKTALMRAAHVLLVPSVKEGWGLVVTEAASQGTPSVVYDVDGLRDAVGLGEWGVISQENTPASMAEAAGELVEEACAYQAIREKAWKKSKEITFDKAYEDFLAALETV